MKKLLSVLLTLSIFISSLGLLSAASFAVEPEAEKNTTRPSGASAAQTLDAGGKAFAMNLSVKQSADSFDLRVLVVENLDQVDHSTDLAVAVSFSGKAGTKTASYALKASGGDFKRYASVTAAGKSYSAAKNHALYGIVIEGIPYDAFSTMKTTVKQGSKTLFTGNMTYGTLFASDPDFQASIVTDLSNKWMSFLGDSTKINRITIPGTHDSGARTGGSMAQTQNKTITEQLEMGVRAFDIRCKVNNGGFRLYHGVTQQPDTFDHVLEEYENFLAEHPGETIIMSMKQEDDDNDKFDSIMASYMAKNPDLWYTTNSIPTLGEVRGKIVLLSRYGGSSAPGIRLDPGFADNRTFEMNNGVACRVQDHYNLGNNSSSNLNTKWTEIEEQLNFAHSSAANNTLCINFTSGYTTTLGIIPSITSVSNSVNPKLKAFFESAGKGCYGLLLSDFIAADLSELIFMTNFAK